MVNVEKAFTPVTSSVYVYYQRPGVGLYIPPYQREYSWGKDNIEQLLDDIAKGVESLIEEPEKEIRFLGTIIAVRLADEDTIFPIDRQGLPQSIENIIDGQQRLSTISLFSTMLFKQIVLQERKLKSSTEEEEFLVSELKEACLDWKDKLKDVFSFNLKRGTPKLKPKIIRGHDDQWTKDGNVEDNYRSTVANYLATFIEYAMKEDGVFPTFDKKSKLGKSKVVKNVSQIESWLTKIVIPAHESMEDDDFTPGWEIVGNVDEKHIWQQDRPELIELLGQKEAKNRRSLGYVAASLVQLFSVAHYLLDRCCFTVINPKNENWAFDMFQSLNATGTPLTAIETFKPTVVNIVNKEASKEDSLINYKGSDAEKSFKKIDALFSDVKVASKKSKITNELLTSFALVTVKGKKLTSHFSSQRKWLDQTFNSFSSYEEKLDFVHFFGNYANFYKEIWLDYKGESNAPIRTIEKHSESQLASVLLIFLRESNHKMAITILARFYDSLLDGENDSTSDFVNAIKSVAAFYTLWRSAQGNSGLDRIYRDFFRGEHNSSEEQTWSKKRRITVDELKEYLLKVLDDQGLGSKEDWIKKAKNHLAYNEAKTVSKFALFVASDQTMPDSEKPGLMKKAKNGTSKYLNVSKWTDPGLRTVEHIAPQNPKEGDDDVWDEDLYDEVAEWYQKIGNLTLLPLEINASAANRGWKSKYIYYLYLAEKDEAKHQELKIKAEQMGVILIPETVELLQKASFGEHMESLVTLGEDVNWSVELVKNRGERILDILWDKVHSWLDTR